MSRFVSHALARALTVALLALSSLLLGVVGVLAHAHLQRAEPRVGGTVSPAPHEVSLWFTEGLEPAFSTLEVRDTGGERVDEGEAQITGSTMRIGLQPLPPGTYKVFWRVLSVDTHKTDGNFSFRVGK
jgi:copper resistance protein C